jgi:hypothetical protein
VAYSDAQLIAIYDRSSGYCHICRKMLALSNYGGPGARGEGHGPLEPPTPAALSVRQMARSAWREQSSLDGQAS